MHLGLKIKVARLSKGLSQKELAEKINKTRPLISHIEQTGMVNSYTLAAISDVLGISPDSIENIVNEPDSQSLTDNEMKRMREEIALLKALVESQEQTISLLKEKLGKKR